MLLNPFYEPFQRAEDEQEEDNESGGGGSAFDPLNGSGIGGGLSGNNREQLMTFKLKLDELVAYYET